MIVKCERCQTRFKIPDEKVTDKGVKVRCTKCQHTFKVAREDSSSAAPAPGVPSPDPAAKPPATPRAGTPLEAPRAAPPAAKAPARPGNLDNLFDGPVSAAASVPGIAAPRGGAPAAMLPRAGSLEPPKTPATIDLDPLMEFMGENTPTPAEALKLASKAPIPNKPAGALATGPVQAPKPAAPAPKPAQAAAPVQVPAKSPPVQVPAKRPALSPVSSAPFSFDENNPFGATDTEATLPAPVPTLPPRPVPTPVPARSAPPAPKPAQAAAPGPVQVPARSPAPAPRAAAPVSFEEPDPFSLPSEDAPTVPATPTVPPRGAAPAPRAAAPVSFAEPDPFSLPPDDAPTMRASPTLPAAAPAPVYEEMEGLEGNNPFVSFEPPPPAPAPKPARAAPVPVPAAAPSEMEGLDGNNPFAAFDPVAALPPASAKPPAPAPSPAPAAPSAIPDWGAPQQGAPSGIPDWGAPQQGAPSGIPDWGAPQTVAATPTAKANAPTERNPFPVFPGPGEDAPGREVLADLPPAPPPPVIAAPPPPKVEQAPGDSAGPRIARRLASVAAQFMVAAVLVVGLLAVAMAWLNDGRVELSPARMRELVSPTRPLVAKDLSNGLYETGAGHSLFFVRGEVENRGTSAIRVKAGVAMYEGEQRVKSAEGIAGAVPTPEELHQLKSAADADTLRARLDAAAKEVAPGARAPFVVFFYEYPSDLANFRLEVTLEPQTAVASGGSQEGSVGDARP
ncbi:MAG TPA: zinc-ribbon domain-containing protein [Archangium sp.]|nr:zinc-ribbon domain-containing protein [Archangium sp.]